ncbi:MAG: 3-keto-5-aminohexanoate cleavage protein [Jhaorihella sp.]
MTQTYSLMVAPNGARRGKQDHPALPVTPEEIAQAARSSFDAGADTIHLHVRGSDRQHTLDPALYRDAMDAIEETAPDMNIQITTEAGGIYDVAAQLACLNELRPGAASIAVREMARDPERAARVYALARETTTRVQHILYGPDCIARLRDWCGRGLIVDTRPEVILVLGQYAPPIAARPDMLAPMLDLLGLDRPVSWTVCAFGRAEPECLLATLRAGGNVRIGFENNIELHDGTLFADNAASVRAFVAAARAEGFSPRRLAPEDATSARSEAV